MQRAKSRAASLSVAVGLLLLVVKVGAWLITGSVAILSDALESVVHIIAVIFTAYSVRLASRPADRSHPYGHGKVEYFSAGVEGLMIVIAAIAIVYQATMALLRGSTPAELEAGTLLTAVAALILVALGRHIIAVGRRTRSLALVADGQHILTDSFTSFGVVAGLAAVYATGWTVLDPLIALVVAANILHTGGHLMRSAVGGLMDEADAQLLGELAQSMESLRTDECIDLHRLRAWRSSDLVHVDAHLMIPRYRTVMEAHELMHDMESKLRKKMGQEIRLLLHLDPCSSEFCPACAVSGCSLRTVPFKARPVWELDAIVASV